ncbi:thioredoxin domain-containing protein [Demequina sp. NBRC 110053]|uniref:DsbA family protein n=1 Tax=Demequina sp. NBRC 110053 TaxID=1570342 RepID=UPI000A0130A0|nr:thioredoxin domain-containing protein [Demequina sp. NBRC 110053]
MAKNTSAPKNAKAAAARAQAQKNVKSQERRTTLGIIIGVAIAIVVFGGIVLFIVQSSQVPGLDSADAVAPAGADETGGIPIGADGAAGGAVPADAPRLDIYEDFNCVHCASFEATNGADIEAMAEAEEAAIWVHPIAFLGDYSTRAANAAATVADAEPEAYLDFTSALFASRPESGGLTDDQIEQVAVDAGVSADVAATFTDGTFTKWVLAATDQASQDGVTGTPSLMLDRELLTQEDVLYTQPGALRTFIQEQ